MSHKTLIRIAGVVGGLCWLAQAAVNDYDAAENAVNALYWGGGVLILVALVGLGAGLVSGAPGCAWSSGSASRCWSGRSSRSCTPRRPDSVVDGGFGLALALICAASLLGGASKDDRAPARGGAHAK